MTFAQAALIEPLSVGAGAVERANVRLGQPALVCGAGPIGLAAAICARAAGAHPIALIDMDESRLDFARTHFGFKNLLCVQPGWSREETVKQIRLMFGPDEECLPDIAFECTGAQSSIVSALAVSTIASSSNTLSLMSFVPMRLGDSGRWNAAPSRMWQTRCRNTAHGYGFP